MVESDGDHTQIIYNASKTSDNESLGKLRNDLSMEQKMDDRESREFSEDGKADQIHIQEEQFKNETIEERPEEEAGPDIEES